MWLIWPGQGPDMWSTGPTCETSSKEMISPTCQLPLSSPCYTFLSLSPKQPSSSSSRFSSSSQLSSSPVPWIYHLSSRVSCSRISLSSASLDASIQLARTIYVNFAAQSTCPPTTPAGMASLWRWMDKINSFCSIHCFFLPMPRAHAHPPHRREWHRCGGEWIKISSFCSIHRFFLSNWSFLGLLHWFDDCCPQPPYGQELWHRIRLEEDTTSGLLEEYLGYDWTEPTQKHYV